MVKTAPKSLRDFVDHPEVETIPVCAHCGRVVLGRDIGLVLPRRFHTEKVNTRRACTCPPGPHEALTLARCLPKVDFLPDAGRVTWTPILPKDVDICADGQGAVVIYKRSKQTMRMVEIHRIPPHH